MNNCRFEYKAVFEAISSPCALLDENLCFVEVNQAYTDMLMKAREELIGVYIWDVFPEQPEQQPKLNAAFHSALGGETKTLEEVSYEIVIPEEDGSGVQGIWWNVHATPISVADNQPAIFLLKVEDVTARVQARIFKDTIASELQHRVGNLLNVVLTIARQTGRNAKSIDDFLDSFASRVLSLSKTHKALTGGNWDGMSLRQLAEQELEVYAELHSKKIKLDGPELKLTAMEAQAISIALHELATNAAKYGALKNGNGQLQISWKPNAINGYEIEWHESGLSDIREPETLGFGSMILTRILPSQLNGEATREFAPTSHIYRLLVPERKTWDVAEFT